MRVSTIKLEGKVYPLVYSLNAIEKIEDAYVPIEELSDLLLNPKKYDANGVTAVKDILYIYMCEGIAYCNHKGMRMINDEELICEVPSKEELYCNLAADDIELLTSAICDTMIASKKK